MRAEIRGRRALFVFGRAMALRVVENDLRALSLEARKKLPEVKEAAERALAILRAAAEALPPGATPAEVSSAIAARQEVLLPFTLALGCRSESLPPSALGAVQRIISHAAVAPHRLPAITSQLIARAQTPGADEPSLLKVLQTVLTIASSPALLHTDTVVSQLLLLCLTMQQHKSPTIKSTASATAQQFIALLLELAAQEAPEASAAGDASAVGAATPKAALAPTAAHPPSARRTPGRPPAPPESLRSLTVASRCAYLSIQDMCLLASGESATWLPGSSGPVSVTFALEVLQRSLDNQTKIFEKRAPFRQLLIERAFPLLGTTLAAAHKAGAAAPEWAVGLRLAHLSATIVARYAHMLPTEARRLLSLHARMLEDERKPVMSRKST